MAKLLFLLSCLVALNKASNSQYIRQPTTISRPPPESVTISRPPHLILPPAFKPPGVTIPGPPGITAPRQQEVITPPCNASPSTILITDSSPEICQNLANTLQLLTVCNMLQGTQGGQQIANQLAAPLIRELLSNPAFSCGCSNPIFNTLVSPNVASSLVQTLAPPRVSCTNSPTLAPQIVSSSPNLFSSNLISSSLVSPNLISSNVVSPNFVQQIPSGASCGCPKAMSQNVLSQLTSILAAKPACGCQNGATSNGFSLM